MGERESLEGERIRGRKDGKSRDKRHTQIGWKLSVGCGGKNELKTEGVCWRSGGLVRSAGNRMKPLRTRHALIYRPILILLWLFFFSFHSPLIRLSFSFFLCSVCSSIHPSSRFVLFGYHKLSNGPDGNRFQHWTWWFEILMSTPALHLQTGCLASRLIDWKPVSGGGVEIPKLDTKSHEN